MAGCPTFFFFFLPEIIQLCLISQRSLWNCCFYNSFSVSNEVIEFLLCTFAISSIKVKQNNQNSQRKMAEEIVRPVYYSRGGNAGT